ncbi:sialate O-acetylesterase [Rufibacter psychrotolerans]|uniref:sialate O-acetylesterase n=1 Tax=Rufibacter psychrotolerans TaxID=2812556 RepID=UPI0019688177|nr:sialate O-acetylesterase [Rufibacter sp. SYSU D00308]
MKHNPRVTRVSVFLLLLLCASSQLWAQVKLPALFADNMVLQQKSDVAIWGWAAPGEAVEVSGSWSRKSVKTTANAQGAWQVTLPTTKAGGPYTLTFKGSTTLELRNVLLGEVWLCSGQSNMFFPVGPSKTSTWAKGVVNHQQEMAQANFPQIRMFTVEQQLADEPQPDVRGNWQVCSPQTVGDFSAVAFFFAREIHQETGLPVGLISSSWGGTPAESWTQKEVLEANADLRPILERYKQALTAYPAAMKTYTAELEKWQKEAEAAKGSGQEPKPAPKKPTNPTSNKAPSQLYNAMIAPLVPFTSKGVLWYQGESNSDRAYQYRTLFPAMIANWRTVWKKDLPFYFVQITPHRGQRPEIREAQLLTMQTVANTGMVVTTDVGDSTDIHPRNKQVVGKRLALWALAKDYGKKKVVYSGPIYKSLTQEGDRIRLTFDHVGGGLVAKDGPLAEFTIAGADQKFMPAQARIEGNTVVVWSDGVKNPVAVRFAWKKVPLPNLFNQAGLPASPFRTDTWPADTYGKL